MCNIPKSSLENEAHYPAIATLKKLSTGYLGGCPRIDILVKIEVFQKNTCSHIVDITSKFF